MASLSTDEESLPGIILPIESDTDDNLQVTPLMVAAYHGDVGKVSTLLQRDSQSTFTRNIYGQTPLSYAIDKGHIKVIDILLAYGADIDDVDYSGASILHRCVHLGSISKVKTCITIGVNLDITDNNGNTPLIIAATTGQEYITQLLITSGCDINVKNREGLDAIEQSFCSNHTKVQSILTEARELDMTRGDSCQTEMLQSCKEGNEYQVQHFIQMFGTKILNFRHQLYRCQTPMLVASHYGHLSCCKMLRESGAYVDTPDDILDTPLIESTSQNNLDVVRWLIAQGARINHRNLKSKTPLHYAVTEGNLAIVKHLVENGALFHHRMFDGHTALHMAATYEHLDILEYILQEGAVADVRRANGVTPLLHAVEHKNVNMVKSLVKYGASVNGQDNFCHSPLSVAVTNNALHIVTYLVENGADVNAITSHGISVTEIALIRGYNDIAAVLRNANTSARNSILNLKLDDTTAQAELFQICDTGQGSYKNIGELLGAGANVNAVDNFGRTPLIMATQSNSEQCVQYLLQASANVFTRDKKSFTALGYAVINGNVNIVQLLLQNVENEDNSSENVQNELERALRLCITERSNANVENMKIILEHKSYRGYKRESTLELMEKSITAENVDIVELLFNYQLQHDSFEPGIIVLACPSPNLEIVQHFSSFVYKSQHQSAYIKCVIRFCFANQLSEALSIFAHKPIKIQDVLRNSSNHLWFCSDNVVFNTATEFIVRHGLDIKAQREAFCTFLVVAASKGMDDIVEYLLKKKDFISDVTASRENAFHMSLDTGHYKTATLLSKEALVVTG